MNEARFWETTNMWVFELLKTIERIHLYNRQTTRLYASIIFTRRKERFRLGTYIKQKGTKRPNEQWGLNRFMACQPRIYSQFLYKSSLAAHMLTVFKTSTMNIKTTDICSYSDLILNNLTTAPNFRWHPWSEQRVTTAIIFHGACTTRVRPLFHI